MPNNNHQNVSAVTKYVAARLTALRNERRWSQESLALTCGLHRNEVGRMERGETNARIDTICYIVSALGMSWGEFFKDFNKEKFN